MVKRLRLFIREIKEFREFREMVSRETLNSLYSLNSLNSLNSLPQCGRKHTFTRYIDTENNNQYLSERVGKSHRLDKCGYHYTPKQYFADNPHKRDWECENVKYIGEFTYSHSHTPPPRPICTIPE